MTWVTEEDGGDAVFRDGRELEREDQRRPMQMEVGAVLDGKVTGLTNFGAFVSLPGGRSGLVHISEVADTFVRDVHDFLTEQQEVKVKVISISPEGKISLSIKQAAPDTRPGSSRAPARRPVAETRRRDADGTVVTDSGNQQFEDKLKRFMQESDGKMSGNKLFQQQRKVFVQRIKNKLADFGPKKIFVSLF